MLGARGHMLHKKILKIWCSLVRFGVCCCCCCCDKLLPSWLLKECVDELSPIVTSIVNASLNHAIVPLSLKTALIRPLLKKSGLIRKF